MKLKVRDVNISTGGPLIAILNKEDTLKSDLHPSDRIKITKGKKFETVTVDIAEKQNAVPPGSIGIFKEVKDSLKLRNNDIVKVKPARKPLSIEFIKKKLDGKKLTKKEIDQIVWDIVHNKLSDIELTYFVAASYTNVMSMDETIMLTKAMAKHGDTLKLNKYPVIDKHSIGGIPGNRTTMVIVPIIAAAGFTIPKTSSKSITSPAGTADTMEVLADVSFPINKLKRLLNEVNAAIVWGGSLNLAPADDKIINVEKPLEIDAESQLLASIMAKKLSVSSTHILIDIPTGEGAKIRDKKEALNLKRKFENIGKRLRKHTKVLITDGKQPIGNGIGPALEARDVLLILKRDPRRPLDLENKCLLMCHEIFKMLGIKNGRKKAYDLLNSGKAYKKMVQIIHYQNGKIIDPDKIRVGKFSFDIKSHKKGIVRKIDNRLIARVARVAGAPDNKGAGIYLHKHLGNKVKKGDKLFTIYSESKFKLKYARDIDKKDNCFEI